MSNFTCPADEAIFNDYNCGRCDDDSDHSPLPDDCRKWLANITKGAAVEMIRSFDPFDMDGLDDFEVLRGVDGIGPQNIYESYQLLRQGDHLVVRYCENFLGEPTWCRFDLKVGHA